MIIKDINNKYFKQAWEIYEYSFPSNEKRYLEEQKIILKNKNYCFEVYIEDDIVISILMYWNINEFTFIEHFAINKNYRSLNYGSEILKEFSKNKKVILEIDLLENEIAIKRYKFYKNLNFEKYDYKHFQVNFRKNEKKLELLILSNTNLEYHSYEYFLKNLKKKLIEVNHK